jgi:uncharacterized protein YeaO (DUF488 family)
MPEPVPRLRVRRIYDPPDPGDGVRILVDRLWPRGLAKHHARIDFWAKDAAPSDALRHWYQHDPGRWDEFRRRYAAELDANAEAVTALRRRIGGAAATLLFSAKEVEYNNAVALKEYLERA